MVFLPALDTDELEEVHFTVEKEEDILKVACVYGEDESGESYGNTYPIQLNGPNSEHVDSLEQLIVLHPSDQSVEDLTDDPQTQDDLRELFNYIEELEDQLEEQPPPKEE